MKNFEEFLIETGKKQKEVPQKIEYRVQYTLKNKNKINKGGFFMKKIITIMSSIMFILMSGISVYAAFGGEIAGKPIIEWIGIKYSNNYDDYKIKEEQKISVGKTTVELVSTLCDEGFTILEFDVKISDKDKEKLKLGEKMVTEKDFEEAKEKFENVKIPEELKAKLINPPETFEDTSSYRDLKYYEDYENTLQLLFNTDINSSIFNINNNVIIDGEKYNTKNYQTILKKSDNEYKIYQFYLITEKEIGDKTEFTITLKNNALLSGVSVEQSNIAHKEMLENEEDKNKGPFWIGPVDKNVSMNIEGEFNIKVSKKNVLENSRVIENINQEIKYKDTIARIEKVTITPMQIVIKLTSEQIGQSSSIKNGIVTPWTGSGTDEDINDFVVYDENSNILNNFNTVIDKETFKIFEENNKKYEVKAGNTNSTIVLPPINQNPNHFTGIKVKTTRYIIIENTGNIKRLKVIPINKYDKEKSENGFNIYLN